jgi:hypothetical protein
MVNIPLYQKNVTKIKLD